MAELTTLARPYAKAVFRLALEQKNLAEWSDVLALLAAFMHDKELAAYLSQPRWTAAEQAAALCKVAGEAVSPQAQALVGELAHYKRLTLLPYIAALYEQYRADQERSVEVQVTSAYDMTPEQTLQLKQALGRRLGREVHIASHTDASLLGGVIVHAGDLVIDASVRGRIAKLRDSLNS
ncbi:MAG: F0F1 ATP synthase subunit delta [Pseudomonadales bacterium]|nr:F0F1 ATP synthase subunit delta [Pseudomonadales bacterium]